MYFYPVVLSRIRAAPIQFLGRKSPVLLEVFFNGYGTPKSSDSIWLEFNAWLADRFKVHTTTRAPSSVFLLVTNTEEEAFDLYFEELDLCVNTLGGDADRPGPQLEQPVTVRMDSLLEAVARTPCGYLYSNSVTSLRVLLDACMLGWQDAGRVDPSDIDLGAFERWLCQRSGLARQYRWEKVLLYDCLNDEDRALKRFFESCREYRETIRSG